MDESYLEWLSSIPGSDAERARRIAERFSTYGNLRAAPREELLAIEGLSPSFVDSLLGLLGTPSDHAAEHLFLCPECGSFAGPGATRCAFCGVEFESSKESELAGQLSDFLEEEDASRICQTCGATMGAESTTCPVCGRQYDAEGLALLPSLQPHLDEAAPFCSRCGAYLFSEEGECAICGTLVSGIPEPAAGTKVVDTHLIEALDHYDSLLRADPSLVVAWRTKAEILERLERPEEARAAREEADRREGDDRFARAAVTGLQSNGLATSGPTGVGRTNGRVNGTRNGHTNGRTNGRMNGRVNGLGEGRVNGLTNGSAGGLTFGRGATNGLVNGNGFTNGRRGRHPTPRIPAQPHWSRSVIGIAAVVALMVIVPILASMLSTGPTGPSSILQIDGNFGDWSNQRSYGQAFSGPVGNPSVHLVAVKVATQDRELFVYARVQGLMFQGSGVNETDSIFVFVDEDNSRTTGYPIGDLGADSLVEVYGWRDLADIQHGVTSMVFNETSQLQSNDWHRFIPGGLAEAAFNGPELEIRTDVRDPARARVLVYAADNLGNFNPADGSIRANLPTLIVGQQLVAQDIVASPAVPFLRVTLAPMGGAVHVNGVNVTRRGTSADPVSLALYRDDGSGSLDANDTFLSNATLTGNGLGDRKSVV